jgi:hypothetical protein
LLALKKWENQVKNFLESGENYQIFPGEIKGKSPDHFANRASCLEFCSIPITFWNPLKTSLAYP